MSRAIGSTVVVALVALGAREAAASEGARLQVRRGMGAESCGETRELAAAIERVLGRRVFGGDATLSVDVAYSRGEAGYHAAITLRGDKTGTRALDDASPTCDALREAVAVTVSLLIDKPAERPVGTSPPTDGFVEVGGALDLGFLPRLAPELRLGLGLRFLDRFRAAIGAGLSPSESVALPPGTVRVGLTYGWLRLCGEPTDPHGGMGLLICARGTLGSMAGTGSSDYVEHGTARRLWSTVGLGGEVRQNVTGTAFVSLRLFGDASLRRQSFYVADVGTAWTAPRVAADGEISLGLLFF